MLSHHKVRLATRQAGLLSRSRMYLSEINKSTLPHQHFKKNLFSSKVFVSILKKLIVLVLQCIIMLSNHGVSWFLNMVESFSLKYRNISKKHEVTRCRNLGCWAFSAPTWTKPKQLLSRILFVRKWGFLRWWPNLTPSWEYLKLQKCPSFDYS